MTARLECLAAPPAAATVALRGLLPQDLLARFAAAGIDAGEARRVFAAAVNRFADDLAGVRGLRRTVREAVLREAFLDAPQVLERREAADGFVKYLFALRDGLRVEAVRIPLELPRASVCISSMVGCQLRCAFCATGRLGYARSLAADEMVGQFLRVRAESPRPVTSAVFMGMGEPLLNYDAVMRAAYILSQPGGGGISSKAISIGTAGVVPAIRRFTAEGHPFRLFISMTAASSEKRRRFLPHEAAWPVEELAETIRERARTTRGRVNVAWVMIAGVNTGDEDAADLARLLAGVPLIVNLIDVQDPTGRFQAPGEAERRAFRAALSARLGQPTVWRYSGGAEVGAACGMLAAQPVAAAPPVTVAPPARLDP
jgi:23S rRNA (adenine2503-C2)-methyltransferase